MAALDRSLISPLPLFQGLAPDEQSEILRDARSSRYAKDSTIFAQEAEAHSFFVLIAGHIRVVRTTPDGQQVIARYISEGEIFGVAAALGRTTYPASAVAAVDCVVLAWPNALWPDLYRRFPVFGAATYRTVGSRLQETQTRVVEMSTEQVEQRVAHALLRLVNQTGRKTDSGIEIDFPISRQHIAEMTGTTLHTVSRLLSKWEENGIIVSGRQRVTVKDAHRLVVLAETGKRTDRHRSPRMANSSSTRKSPSST
ncbi:Crp/Fnr family transcriptional regulator [Mesorhizobium sp. L103C119B0]|uniref:Crp/Fnr family transcriptional regulator n=1 Tax=Mesorhizobium sp. L103C119B0 TaxID=1287085 RepID=UPI0003D065D8|nr:Crp/Fnr family transcriptional regulator [Mesorhizobium sp. L103C119B0]ESZ68146.1 Crp/Fnr family transcriptional regulator [Mesorhizobium sp. L103C119B0]